MASTTRGSRRPGGPKRSDQLGQSKTSGLLICGVGLEDAVVNVMLLQAPGDRNDHDLGPPIAEEFRAQIAHAMGSVGHPAGSELSPGPTANATISKNSRFRCRGAEHKAPERGGSSRCPRSIAQSCSSRCSRRYGTSPGPSRSCKSGTQRCTRAPFELLSVISIRHMRCP